MELNLPSLSALLEDFAAWRIRIQFTGRTRVNIYRALGVLMNNGVKLQEAIHSIYMVESQDEAKPNRPTAIVLRHCLNEIGSGRRLSVALRKYVNYEECSLIATGEKDGDMKAALTRCVRIISKKGEILGAVTMATAYPVFLFGMACVLLNMVATRFVPKFAKLSNPETWEGPSRLVYLMGTFVSNYGAHSLAVIALLVVLLWVSFGHLRGPVRIYLDRAFPWSLYRMLHGSTFLLNVSVQIASGIKLQLALEALMRSANPWLAERIQGALYGINTGANLGVALQDAGYEFPDRTAVRYLVVLANQDGFEEAVANFAEDWMDESVRKAKSIGHVVLGVGLALIGVLSLVILAGVQGVTENLRGMN